MVTPGLHNNHHLQLLNGTSPHGLHSAKAVQNEQQRQLQENVSNQPNYIHLLRGARSLPAVRAIHACLAEARLIEEDAFLATLLLQTYIKCGSLEDARCVFDRMSHHRDVVSWTSMVAAYARCGHCKEAFHFFRVMQLEGTTPNKITLVSILNAVAGLADGIMIHACVYESGLGSDAVLGNALIHMYGKAGALHHVQAVFEKMPQRNAISWTAVIAANAKHGHFADALRLFQRMQLEGIASDEITLVTVINACASSKNLAAGVQIHACVVESGLAAHVLLGNAIVNMYGECGNIDNARMVFDGMPARDEISWNSMIGAYAQHGQHFEDATRVFRHMKLDGVRPTKVTFIEILDAWASSDALAEGKLVHAHIFEAGYQSDDLLVTGLVSMYGKCRALEDAARLFEAMPRRDVILWTAVIAAYAQNGHPQQAHQLFRRMQLEGVMPNGVTCNAVLELCDSPAALEDGKLIHACIAEKGYEIPDVTLGNSIVNMYRRCGSLEDARSSFERMHRRDVVSWNSMIAANAQHGQPKDALLLYRKLLLDGLKPEPITFVTVLDACSNLVAQAESKLIHEHILESQCESDTAVGAALVNVHGKCGNLDLALCVFEKMAVRDIFAWSAIVAAYAQQGDSTQSLQFFRLMQQDGVDANDITYVNLLSACSHAGMVEDCCRYFASLEADHCIRPTSAHYGCIVDALGRAGHLDEALSVTQGMPFQDKVVWMALLGACRLYGDVDRGSHVADQLIKLDPENASAYVALLNMLHA